MKQNILYAVALIFLLLSAEPTYSQITAQAGGGLGITIPTSDYSGSTIDYYGGQAYGLSTGFSLNGKLRVGDQSFAVVGELGIAFLNNSGNSEPGQGKVEVSQNILSFKVGPEYRFTIPSIPLTPYVAANLALHRFSGETTFQGVSRVPSATFSVESSTRFGIGFAGGVLVTVSPNIDLDFGVGYHLMNLGGKEWVDVNPSQDEQLDSYLALNDARDPLFTPGDEEHFVSDDRSISAFQIVVSVLFGL